MIVIKHINESSSAVLCEENAVFNPNKMTTDLLNKKGEVIDIDTVRAMIGMAIEDMNKYFKSSIGKVLSRKPVIITDNPYIERMATDGINIYINPNWVLHVWSRKDIGDDLIIEAMAFVLAHEALHIIFRHVYEQDVKNKEYFDFNRANVAQDCQINLYIKHALGSTYTPFKTIYRTMQAIYDEAYIGQHWTDIYNGLPDDHPNLRPQPPKMTSPKFKKGFSDGYAYGLSVLKKNKLIERCHVL